MMESIMVHNANRKEVKMNPDEEEFMNAIPESEENFESNLFLSTDGKMTVSIKAVNPAQRKAGARYAKDMYFWLKENFGSKQAFATKEYKAAESGLGVCSKCGAPNLKSMKGKVYCSNKCWLEK
jgi:hypothetical protein